MMQIRKYEDKIDRLERQVDGFYLRKTLHDHLKKIRYVTHLTYVTRATGRQIYNANI